MLYILHFGKCRITFILHYSIIRNSFTAQNTPWAKLIHFSFPPLTPLIATDRFTVSTGLPFAEHYIVGTYGMSLLQAHMLAICI